ncbi:MAG: stage II sporulation protein R [Clostridia bacterium]|nr:stage II sporulation protein R [Clostridia bacterium]
MKSNNKMKGLILLLFVILLCVFSLIDNDEVSLTYEDKIIRFHVIANSNSEEDQALKLKVRDEIIKSLNNKLQSSENIFESRKILENNLDFIEDTAHRTLLKNGYVYAVKAHLGTTWIPEKTYGTITFPAGEYEALNVVIGEGKGNNWWCVLFPPLCLIDSSKPSDEINIEESLDMLTKEEYQMIINAAEKNEPVLKLKFLTLEKAETIKEKIQELLFKENTDDTSL